jgi:hypothetical protein
MKKKNPLNITPAVEAFAMANGAYFDVREQTWFVDGEVPSCLISFVLKEVRYRDYVAEKVPTCPRCRCEMLARPDSITGQAFWCCTNINCSGHRRFEDQEVPSQQVPLENGSGAVKFEDKDRAARVIKRAVTLFRNEPLAMNWLKSSKVALRDNGSTPMEAVKTIAGCAIVDRLLDERFE